MMIMMAMMVMVIMKVMVIMMVRMIMMVGHLGIENCISDRVIIMWSSWPTSK